MRIGGWTRVWFVASGLWIACTIYAFGPDLYRLRDTAEYEVDREDFGRFRIVFSAAQPEKEVFSYINDHLFAELEKSPKRYDGKIVTKPYDEYVMARQGPMVLEFIQYAVLPVAGLLIIGFSLAWVRRGFRDGADAS